MTADCGDVGEELDRARATYRQSGIGGRVGYGDRPALLIVDFQRGFTDPDCPVGGDLSAEIAATKILLDAARHKGLPIAFTAVGCQRCGRCDVASQDARSGGVGGKDTLL